MNDDTMSFFFPTLCTGGQDELPQQPQQPQRIGFQTALQKLGTDQAKKGQPLFGMTNQVNTMDMACQGTLA